MLGLLLAAVAISGLSARSPEHAASPRNRGWDWDQGWDWGRALPPPIPANNPMSAAKVELGRRLFYDADLSINGTQSCATCHEQRHAFADGNRVMPGARDDPGRRNVPALANLAWLSPLTWADPRQTTLERQVAVPVLGEHPIEMAMAGNQAEIVRRLARDPCYRDQFAQAFPKARAALTYGNAVRAIAAFERTLIARDSAWDRARTGAARGQPSDLSAYAREGAALFGQDCASCHAGRDLTDARFHRVAGTDSDHSDDAGLAEVTGRPADTGRFRTPSLRNVAVTAPYFHDGASPTLPAAIRRHRAFAHMPEGQVHALIAFLDVLTDTTFLADPRFALPLTACGKPL